MNFWRDIHIQIKMSWEIQKAPNITELIRVENRKINNKFNAVLCVQFPHDQFARIVTSIIVIIHRNNSSS